MGSGSGATEGVPAPAASGRPPGSGPEVWPGCPGQQRRWLPAVPLGGRAPARGRQGTGSAASPPAPGPASAVPRVFQVRGAPRTRALAQGEPPRSLRPRRLTRGQAGVKPPPAFLTNSAKPASAAWRPPEAGSRGEGMWGGCHAGPGPPGSAAGPGRGGGGERPGTSASVPQSPLRAVARPTPPGTARAEGHTAAAGSPRPARCGLFSRHWRQRGDTASRTVPARQPGTRGGLVTPHASPRKGPRRRWAGPAGWPWRGWAAPLPREGGKKSKLVMSYYFFLWQCSESLQMSAC